MNLPTQNTTLLDTPIPTVETQVSIDVVIGALKLELMTKFSQHKFEVYQDSSADGFCIKVTWMDGVSGYKLLNTLGKYSLQGISFRGETYSYETLEAVSYEGQSSNVVDSVVLDRLTSEPFIRETMETLSSLDLSKMQVAANRNGEGCYPRYLDIRTHLDNKETMEALRHELAYRSVAGQTRTEASGLLAGSSLLAKAAQVLNETQAGNFSQPDLDEVAKLESDYLYVLQSIKALDASYRTIYSKDVNASIQSKGYKSLNIKETIARKLHDLHGDFVHKVYNYFSTKYQVKIEKYDTSDFASHGKTVEAKELLRNISKQIGSSFEELSERQIIDEGTKQFFSYEREQAFTGKSLKLTGQLRLDPYNTKKKKEMSHEWFHRELPVLKRAIAFFETGNVSDDIIKRHADYFSDAKWFDAGQVFKAPEGNLITQLRFFGNATIQLNFVNKEEGQRFVNLYSILVKEGGK